MRRVVQIVFPVLALGLSLSLTQCGGESTTGTGTTGACSNGICGSGGTTTTGSLTTGSMGGSPTTGSMTTSGMGGTPSTGAGMTTSGMGGSPATTGSSTTTTTAGVTSSAAGTTSAAASTGSGGCVESWLCTPWDGGLGDNGTRVCTDTNNCGTMVNKPAETATLPALDLNYFKCNVEPILDAKCSMMGCHGTEVGRALRVYSRGKLRDANVSNAPAQPPPTCPTDASLAACTGTNDCHCAGPHAPEEWKRNFDAARGMMLDVNGNPLPAAQAANSDLIQQPVVGGKSHAGVHLFKTNDADYTTIKSWLSGSTLLSCNPVPN
ncbi:MAG: hypothetical protein ABJE95_16690 [Byssovorax sp.]